MNRTDICVTNKIHITFQVPKVPNYLIREAFLGEKFLPYSARSPCESINKFCLLRGDQKILSGFYNGGL